MADETKLTQDDINWLIWSLGFVYGVNREREKKSDRGDAIEAR